MDVREAKSRLAELLDRAHRGEEIVLSKDGEPFARLVPIAEALDREPVNHPRTLPEYFEPSFDAPVRSGEL